MNLDNWIIGWVIFSAGAFVGYLICLALTATSRTTARPSPDRPSGQTFTSGTSEQVLRDQLKRL